MVLAYDLTTHLVICSVVTWLMVVSSVHVYALCISSALF